MVKWCLFQLPPHSIGVSSIGKTTDLARLAFESKEEEDVNSLFLVRREKEKSSKPESPGRCESCSK